MITNKLRDYCERWGILASSTIWGRIGRKGLNGYLNEALPECEAHVTGDPWSQKISLGVGSCINNFKRGNHSFYLLCWCLLLEIIFSLSFIKRWRGKFKWVSINSSELILNIQAHLSTPCYEREADTFKLEEGCKLINREVVWPLLSGYHQQKLSQQSHLPCMKQLERRPGL